jgi:hypothetical protein
LAPDATHKHSTSADCAVESVSEAETVKSNWVQETGWVLVSMGMMI